MTRTRIFATLAICALAAPLRGAEPGPPLSAAAFDALTRGKTMVYMSGGEPYGVERYLPGRRVVWAFVGEECREGYWYEDRGDICFVYEDLGDPQCWTFWPGEQGLMARFRGDPQGIALVAVEESPDALICQGPHLGV